MTRASGATRTVITPSTLARSIEHIPVTVYGASSQASSAVAAAEEELGEAASLDALVRLALRKAAK